MNAKPTSIELARKAWQSQTDAFAEKHRALLTQAVAWYTLEEICERLNKAGRRTPRGCDWRPGTLRRLLIRLGLKTRGMIARAPIERNDFQDLIFGPQED